MGEVPNLLGIPLPILGFLCFVLAAVFVYVWPKPGPNSTRGMWMNMGLHYLHPLAWVLLAMAAFLQNRSMQAALITAALGGVVYLFFLILLVVNRGR
ncbi:MAG: hypothetical protein N2117_06490 [Anaerolineales bacterium]|nr:hypothetical protein [Anaerolineales bacterium]MCX7754880.1 hypothetical protein [Anaerolineales bacterium]MDW8278692.1 hypothetical protein [Anaerolineales bacterium]